MEVQKRLSMNSQSEAKYAVIVRNKTSNEVWLGDEPWHRLPWQEDISLKNVEYNIIEGVLYIKGTQIYYYNFPNILDRILTWGDRSLWTIFKKNNDKLVEPFVETDVYIKRWWWNNKKMRGIDLTDKKVYNWYLSKEENECEVALSNFKLVETYNTRDYE